MTMMPGRRERCQSARVPSELAHRPIQAAEDVSVKLALTATEARQANRLMQTDRAAGEARFHALLRHSPRDGMVLLERGRARLALNLTDAGREDLQNCLRELPLRQGQGSA